MFADYTTFLTMADVILKYNRTSGVQIFHCGLVTPYDVNALGHPCYR